MDRETSHLLCINVPKANIFRNNARISSRNEEKSAFHAIALLDDAFCLYISPRGDLLMRGVYVQTLLWDNALHFNQTFRSFPCVQSRSKHQRLQHKIIAANQCRNSSSVISFRRAESELFTVKSSDRFAIRAVLFADRKKPSHYRKNPIGSGAQVLTAVKVLWKHKAYQSK